MAGGSDVGPHVAVQANLNMTADGEDGFLPYPKGFSAPGRQRQRVANVFSPNVVSSSEMFRPVPNGSFWVAAQMDARDHRSTRISVKAHAEIQVRPGRLLVDEDNARGWFVDRMETLIGVGLRDARTGEAIQGFSPSLDESDPEPERGFTEISFSQQSGFGAKAGTWEAVELQVVDTFTRARAIPDFQLKNQSEGPVVRVIHEMTHPDSEGRPYDGDRPGFSLWPKSYRHGKDLDVGAMILDSLEVWKPDHLLWTGSRKLGGLPESAKSAQSVIAQGLWSLDASDRSLSFHRLVVQVRHTTRYVFVSEHDLEFHRYWFDHVSTFTGDVVMLEVTNALRRAALEARKATDTG